MFLRVFLTLVVAGVTNFGWGFALEGPVDPRYQTAILGYNNGTGDIGGPMNLAEGYRLNFRPITYALDPTFLHYFGPKGSNAVVQAMTILNNLQPFSKMSSDLHEFPLEVKKANYTAETLNILDLKSVALGLVMNEIGVDSAERYVWTLSGRTPDPTAPNYLYIVIQRNFDPQTFAPSPFVNGNLYTYAVVDPVPGYAPAFADAIEFPVDPQEPMITTVASTESEIEYSVNASDIFTVGQFYTGLTRDDVGGLRYLYEQTKANSYVETLPTEAGAASSTVIGSGGTAWSPAPGSSTNSTTGTGGGTGGVGGTGSNGVTGVTIALRPGIDKLQFTQVFFDSTYGSYGTQTNIYIDTYMTNGVFAKQSVQRVVTSPDILFMADDLGLNANGVPIVTEVTAAATPTFVNNAANNSAVVLTPAPGGPGQINPPITIIFNKVGPYYENTNPNFVSQGTSLQGGGFGLVWGSFDGTTNDPIVYPEGLTISDLEQLEFGF